MADEVTKKGAGPVTETTQVTAIDDLEEDERTQQIDSAALLALQEEHPAVGEEKETPTAEHEQVEEE